MKKIFAVIIFVFICISFVFPVYAAEDSAFTEGNEGKIGYDNSTADTYATGDEAYLTDDEQLFEINSIDGKHELVVDNADVLTDLEEQTLNSKLNSYSDSLKCELSVVTVNNTGEKTAQEYADDFYDYNGYGYGDSDDGVLFLYSKDDNQWAVSTYGTGMILTVNTINTLVSGIGDYIRNGEYNNALTKYANDMFTELSSYITHDHPSLSSAYGANIEDRNISTPGTERNPVVWFVVVFAVSFIAAFIVMKAATSNLNSVHAQKNANTYVVPNSFVLTGQRDLFLYSNIVKTAIPKNTSSGGSGRSSGAHVSSSGRTHGGSSGHF